MRNYPQEQKLQLQTLISQEAMLPAKLFKYLRSEEHLPSLLALVDVPGFSEPLMCSVPANQVDRLNKPVSIRDLQPGFRVVLRGLEEDGSLTASRRRAQELIYDRLFLHPDRRQVYQGRVMGISPQCFFLMVEDQPAILLREFYRPTEGQEVSVGDLLPVCFANSSPHQRLWFRSPQDENYLNYPFLEELEPGLIFPARVVGTRNASIFFQIFPGFNAISPRPDGWQAAAGDQILFQISGVSRDQANLKAWGRPLCPVA